MKKFFVFGMVSAIALTFAACSQSNETAPSNVAKDGEAVHTQFSISFPKAKATRMKAGDAQEDEVFSGISDMKLYPFTVATVADATTIDYDVIPLGSLANAEAFTESGDQHMSKVFDVSVPLGTKNFLFYGKKTSTTGGELTATFPAETGGAVTGINFALKAIQDKAIADMAQDTEGAKVLAALNAVETALAADDVLKDMKAAFETNTAGCAVSIDSMLVDLSESLGKNSLAAFATAKAAVDAQITALKSVTFPRNIGLPDGAVSVAFTKAAEGAGGTFAFALNDNKGLGSPELNTYTKPAELYYFANTAIKVDTKNHKSEYAAQATWADVLALYTGGNEVTSTTKSVALVDSINYGVAQLESSVKLKADTQIKDNADTIITPNFDVKGVLVLSQKNVDWKFQPTGEAKYVVYDPVQTGETVNVTAAGTAPNYTLVLESAESEIQVAVELENKGEYFQGYQGQVIPTGTRFYLVGKLTKPAEATSGATQIFQQDYKTIVNFTIGATSLKKAYNTVPDLRTPELELGLSVDLKWQPGMTFDVEF